MKEKRNIRNVILGTCMLILLSSAVEKVCFSSDNNKLYTVNFDGLEVKSDFCYSEMFNSVSIIQLDNSQVLIGEIDKMEVYKGQFIVLDGRHAKGIFVFDKKGSLLRKIGSAGLGPKEYTDCTDFAIDSRRGIIYVYDCSRMNIHVYNIDTGNCLRTIELDKGARINRIWCNNGILYAVNTFSSLRKVEGESYILRQLDVNSGREIKKWMDVDRYNKGWRGVFASSPLFYHVKGGKDLFAFGFSDTIMCINHGNVAPYMAFSGKKVIKPNDISKEEKAEAFLPPKRMEMHHRLGHKMDKITGVLNMFEYDGSLFFSYTTWPMYIGVCNMSTGETSAYRNFKDDVLYSKQLLQRALPSFLVSDAGGVYYCMSTDYLLELKSHLKEGFISGKVKNREVLGGLDEDSNPVILYYEFK